MKKILLTTLLTLIFALPALAEIGNGRDIIVTMNDVTLKSINTESNSIQVTLKHPTINYKVEFDKFGMTPLTPSKFATLWAQRSSFAKDNPNATLSFWDQDGDFFEMDFVIQDVKNTSDGLTLTAQFMSKTQPIHLTSSKQKENENLSLAQFEQRIKGAKNSIVMLIDRSPFDPWRPHHPYS